ncbi:MAG TPA: DUF4065 domain-containing protein [Clostridiales bacterium]|nr:DUF4065 domain-containing protein [Clostridiales bacterium]HQP69334.1 DUF4065 domain-containing protein [Clostridiales bacterium]
MMAMNEYIRKMREMKNISQEIAAKELGYTRQTYIQIESGSRDITLSELKKLSAMFDIPFNKFVTETEPDTFNIDFEEKEADIESKEIRISVPQNRVGKFKEVLLYILSKAGAKPNIGETAIYKLLYFIDFDYYEKYEEQLIGANYIKNHYGPTPVIFKKLTEEMIADNELEVIEKTYYEFNQKKYLPRRCADLSKISAREIKHIDEELERLSDKNAAELSELSHKDVPWITAKEGETIEYEGVFYRTGDTSVRYKKLKDRMSMAAEALYNDYCSDKELTAFTDLI